MILPYSSTEKAQIGLDMIPSQRQRLRSAVDLMHFDCYTNGINKGTMTILKHWELVFFTGHDGALRDHLFFHDRFWSNS